MTKKTRIRIARVAAGAVIAAGASLMVTGVASADPAETCDIAVDTTCPSDPGTTDPGDDDTTEPTDPGTSLPTDPGTTQPTDPGTTEPTDPGTTEPTDPGTTEPTDDPTEPTENPTEPTEEPDPAESTGSAGAGGNGSHTDTNGGSNNNSAQEVGTSALTDTGSDTAAQGDGKELAETGAAETTFLLIGAATMIAGGIGFRVLPRLVNGRGGAAA